MKNADMPANPIFDDEARPYLVGCPKSKEAMVAIGLTKREYFAGLALQAFLAKREYLESHCAKLSVKIADALLRELEKGE